MREAWAGRLSGRLNSHGEYSTKHYNTSTLHDDVTYASLSSIANTRCVVLQTEKKIINNK